jgi:hypothetical protein
MRTFLKVSITAHTDLTFDSTDHPSDTLKFFQTLLRTLFFWYFTCGLYIKDLRLQQRFEEHRVGDCETKNTKFFHSRMVSNKETIAHLQSSAYSIPQIRNRCRIYPKLTITSAPPSRRSSKMPPIQVPSPSRPTPRLPLENGIPPPFVNVTMKALMAMPSARTVTLRPNRKFLSGKGRTIDVEAWLGTQVGTLATRQCTHCAKGSGPFTLCVSVEGRFKESCTNCHYGGMGSRCSFRLGELFPK